MTMRVAICSPSRNEVDNIIVAPDLDTAARLFPDHDCVPMDDTHPAEPGATYARRAAECRVTRSRDGQTRDVARSLCRIAR